MQPMLLLLRSHCCKRLLYVLILSLTSTYAHAYTGAQNDHPVTLNGNNITLRTVFKAIKQQTGFAVMYSTVATSLNQDEKVSVHFKDTPLDDVLAYLLRGKELDWKYSDDVLVIHKKETTVPEKKMAVDSTVTPVMVTGKVTDANGNPLIGATVQVKGTNQGATTDAEGNFALPTVKNGSMLLISSLGYAKREVTVNGKRILTQLNVDISKLDETVVIAYGTTTQRFNTGNVSTIKGEDIAKQPVSNPLLALQGRVPGMEIIQSTGLPGSGVTVRIRGRNSISNGNDPLYIIDGVPYASQLPPNLGSVLGFSGGNTPGSPLSYINPADIESIDILKDADATAIYGSRGANGVVLITTKKGKAGQTKVDVNVYTGIGKITRKVKLLNTQQYLAMRREGFKNDNAVPGPADYDVNGTWDTTRYTDWQKELIGGTAHYTDVQASISGGTTNIQYRLGSNFHRETTVFPGDFSDKRGSAQFTINSVSPNQKLRTQASVNYIINNNGLLTSDLTGFITLAPDAPAIYNADGTLNWATKANGAATWQNPFAKRLWRFKDQTKNLISSGIIQYELPLGLTIKSNFGYTSMQSTQNTMVPVESFQPINRPNIQRTANFSDNSSNTWIIEPQLTYQKVIGKAEINALLGSTFQQNTIDGQILNARGFNSDLLMDDIKSAATVSVSSTTNSVYKYNALFGRLNYNLQEKYLVNLSVRRDGTSRFGPDKQFHNFGAIGAGWIFSQEKWISSTLGNILSFGKLRASYGITGSDQVGEYRFQDLYYSSDGSYQNARGLTINNLYNPDLAWEETRKLEAGLELGFLHDRILFTASYFRNRSSNQLTGYRLPLVTGFSSVSANQDATVQNKGLEFTLNTTNIKTNHITWSSTFNLTINRNKLISASPSAVIDSRTVGQPLGVLFVYHSLGVDPVTGVYQFADEQGKPTFTPPSLGSIVIDLTPRYYGGFQNSISYKGLQLDVLFQFVKQLGRNNVMGRYPGAMGINQPTSVLERWQHPGDMATVQRFDANYNFYAAFDYAQNSDAVFTDASFIRLKNVSLSYQLPLQLLRKASFQNCRIYMQAQNLLTFTHYKGADPENQSITALPPLRVITAGIQFTL